jgi:hypothetical protein
MPIDIVLLLDVSGSMQTHVASLSAAAQDALSVLGPDDRVAIMVFDRATRMRMPFRTTRREIERGLRDVLDEETFDGGTDVTRGLLDAAAYIKREGRREARHAIVILTDDQTERDRDERRVGRALAEADAVLSAILAPDAMGRYGRSGGSWPRGGGGGWPGGGSQWPDLGGIIIPRRGPYGNRIPGGGVTMPRTRSAGSAEIARDSGGDSMNIDDASAFQTTLSRLRQRYALHYNTEADGRNVDLELTAAAQRRYPQSEVRFRRVSQAGDDSAGEVQVSRRRTPASVSADESSRTEARPRLGRRPAVNEPSGDRGASTTGPVGWPRAEQPAPATQPAPSARSEPAPPARNAQPEAEAPRQGGWRKLKPGEQP